MPYIYDERVQYMAICTYNRYCPISPDDVHSMICNEQWTLLLSHIDAVPPETTPAPFNDHRVLRCSLHDLSPGAIQKVWVDGVKTRWFSAVYTFHDSRHARLARGIHSRIFRFTEQTLWDLTLAIDVFRVSDIHVTDVCGDVHASFGTWVQMTEETTDVVGRTTSLVTVSLRHRSAFTCLFVCHEWITDGPFTMHHRGEVAVTLHYTRQTFGGVVVIDIQDSDDTWPWFVLENRMVPPSVLPSLVSSCPCIVQIDHVGTKRKHIDVNDLACDRHVRSVLKTWKKSHESKHTDIPILTAMAHNLFKDVISHAGFVAYRVHTGSSRHGMDARKILDDRFGRKYATCSMERLLFDSIPGFYVVYNSERKPVASFGIIIYYTSTPDLIACCIDSFAVSKSQEGAGVGSMTFHSLIRAVCTRFCSQGGSYVVFAQCLRTGDARLFWYDKLDESTIARSLMLQAFMLDSERIPIQSMSQCTPRARVYMSLNLE